MLALAEVRVLGARQYQWKAAGQLRACKRADQGLLVIRERTIARVQERFAIELDLPRRRGESGRDAVRFLGYVPREDLAALYGLARLCVYPSLYEGFGLPVAEAMACGCPVVTSNVSSLPEVAGDAAVLVDPRSVEDITEGVAALWADAARRRELAARGQARARCFTWERAARETAAVYDSVLG